MSTLLPFLYQTRTLQRLARSGVTTPAFRALLHSTTPGRGRSPSIKPRRSDNTYIPFELPEGYGQEDAETESGIPSTITPAEQDIFNEIFEEIAKKRGLKLDSALPSEQAADKPGEKHSPAAPTVEMFGIRTKEPSKEIVQSTFNFVIQDIADKRPKRVKQAELAARLPKVSPSEWEYALKRFPPSLRRAAQAALGIIHGPQPSDTKTYDQSEPAELSESRPLGQPPSYYNPTDSDELLRERPVPSDTDAMLHDVVRREERVRVQSKMEAARTDFELWEVLEEEVFPLVWKLGIDGSPGDEHGKLPLDQYGPLYPAYLLEALKLFDTHFARPSPLALQILPRVKELGAASYVLGVTTPFYNELARIMWTRYGDPAAVFDLLEEMRSAGLYCDQGTLNLVKEIGAFFEEADKGKHGPFVKELASLPEFEFTLLPRVNHWLKTAHTHINERKKGLVLV
jgi:hypothetical protein